MQEQSRWNRHENPCYQHKNSQGETTMKTLANHTRTVKAQPPWKPLQSVQEQSRYNRPENPCNPYKNSQGSTALKTLAINTRTVKAQPPWKPLQKTQEQSRHNRPENPCNQYKNSQGTTTPKTLAINKRTVKAQPPWKTLLSIWTIKKQLLWKPKLSKCSSRILQSFFMLQFSATLKSRTAKQNGF